MSLATKHRPIALGLICSAAVLMIVSGCGGSNKAARPQMHAVALLRTVTVRRTNATDQIVFTFQSTPRTVSAHYILRSQLVASGSGRPVQIAGAALIGLRFTSAATVDLEHSPPLRTYRGGRSLRPQGQRYIRQLVEVGDLEGVVVWAVGLSQRRQFTVRREPGGIVVLTIR